MDNKQIADMLAADSIKQDKILGELAALKAENERVIAANKVDVEKLNTELAQKGATLKDIQDEVLSIKAKGGKSSTIQPEQINLSRIDHVKGVIWDFIETNKSSFEEKFGTNGKRTMANFSKKAGTITSSSLTGNPYFNYLPAEAGQRPFGQTRFRDFSAVYQSDTMNVLYPVQGTAPNSGSFNYQQTETNAKAQLDYVWSMVNLTLKYFAGYAKVSRQSLTNIPFLQSYLPMNLMEDMLDQEDRNFGAQLYAGATGSTSTTGATSGSDIEYVCAFIKNLIKTKYTPTAIAVDPDKWLSIILTKPGSTVTNYSLPAIASIDSEGVVRLMGRPVLPVNWLTGGQVIVGDWNKVGIVEADGLQLRQTDSDGTDFVDNVLTFLLERAEGLAIFRPDSFISTTLP